VIVQCELCPKNCVIGPGQSGDCRIRVNRGGKLTAVTYGFPSSVHVDPIEKKPLNHFLPGSAAFSLATVGCNFHCKNCQNWEISQCNPEDAEAMPLPPSDLPALAKQYQCASVAYTYTDPAVYYEYALDCCVKIREAGLKNVLVTAGYMNPKPMRELYSHVDAANIDIKSMSDRFYREICDGTLKPVMETMVTARSMGVHVEVTFLVIPTLNDTDAEFESLCKWMKENMGREVPIHFSRFHPLYRLRHLPQTPAETLDRARQIAKAAGLDYVYVGNVLREDDATTHCPDCGEVLVRRMGFQVLENRIASGGVCPKCGKEIYGVWK
jgi:pyruvate formate lyase activating enzyme